MRIRLLIAVLMSVWALFHPAAGVAGEDDEQIRVFGYFQNTFSHLTSSAEKESPSQNSFVMQQLNVLLQRDFATRWSAFVNMEFKNSYSSERMTGDLNLEEAWVRYLLGSRASLKLGLQIPEFNRLDTIKPKTPLLPYIIRPIVYESSLSAAFAADEFVPNRAFVQLYGALPTGWGQVDYAFYLGNSPSVMTKPQQDQTGTDTTDTFLLGGRLGVRVGEVQAGLSMARDIVAGCA